MNRRHMSSAAVLAGVALAASVGVEKWLRADDNLSRWIASCATRRCAHGGGGLRRSALLDSKGNPVGESRAKQLAKDFLGVELEFVQVTPRSGFLSACRTCR